MGNILSIVMNKLAGWGHALRSEPWRFAMVGCLLWLVVAGMQVRLAETGWDSYTALNPDERNNVAAVRDSLAAVRAEPGARPWGRWFDTENSPLNPRVGGGEGIVYGDLPHLLGVAAIGLAGARSAPEEIHVLRRVSAVADCLSIVMVFLIGLWALPIGRTLEGAALAAALYAWTPLALQYAVFFVVDPVMTLCGALGMASMLAAVRMRNPLAVVVAGGWIGAAAACKVSALALIAAVPVAAWLASPSAPRRWPVWGLACAGAGFAAALVLRTASPSLFAGPGFFGLQLSPVWLADMKHLYAQMRGLDQPPHRWLWIGRTPLVYPLKELTLWAFGPALLLAGLFGMTWAAVTWRREPALGLLVVVVLSVALYAGHSEVSALRYWLPLLPAWCVLAAVLWTTATPASLGIGALVLLLTFGWGQALVKVRQPVHTRVEASQWLRDHVGPGMTVTNETPWDEALPWPEAATPRPAAPGARGYTFLMLTEPDTPAKLSEMVRVLEQTDFLVLSSRRQQESMTRLPGRFPLTARYYQVLLDGRLCFAPVEHFWRPFKVFGVPLDDRSAQESWTTYDHPEVRIFRRQPCFSPERALQLLTRD